MKFAEQLVESVAGTRVRVVRSLLEDGPATAAVLAERLGLTPAAVRRHLDALLSDGQVEARDRVPYGPDPRRGRGRPARFYSLTAGGHESFPHGYDDLASQALRRLAEVGGSAAIDDFARTQVAGFEARHGATITAAPPERRVQALADALTADGYAASVDPSPGGGAQVCQHHCPVSHVAAEFPQLCEAETEAFARLLGRHVQRISTIGRGDHVCTTVVPPAPPSTATTAPSVPAPSVPAPSVPLTSERTAS